MGLIEQLKQLYAVTYRFGEAHSVLLILQAADSEGTLAPERCAQRLAQMYHPLERCFFSYPYSCLQLDVWWRAFLTVHELMHEKVAD